MTGTVVLQLQTGVTFADPQRALVYLVSYALVAVTIAGAGALAYRWYFRESIPQGIATLLGVSGVVLILNTASINDVISGTSPGLFRIESVLFNVVALGVAAVLTPVGGRVGDSLATNVFAFADVRELGGVGTIVRSVGRVTTVTLPEEIEDMDDYDPVSDEKKATLSGKTLRFPRRQTVEELRDRFVTRLKDDYGVGHVDVEFAADGTVEYLAVGSRAAGLGQTIAPGSVAVAVRADPAASASPGDRVQVWTTGEDAPSRVLTAELRATAGNVATLVVDEAEAGALDAASASYRLVTLPSEPQSDHEFASLLRAADETMGAVTVREGSELAGATVGDVEGTVVAVRPAGGTVVAIPSRSRSLAPADTLYVIARPETLRRVETQAAQPPPSDPQSA